MVLKSAKCLQVCLLAAGMQWLNGCGGGSSSSTPPPQQQPKIQHVVIIFQENRTPDNLFQDPMLISAGADIQNFGINSHDVAAKAQGSLRGSSDSRVIELHLQFGL